MSVLLAPLRQISNRRCRQLFKYFLIAYVDKQAPNV